MPTYQGGRHEHGQNFLIDTTIIDSIVRTVADIPGPIIEIGSGHGALTAPLLELRRPLTAVEIDRQAASLLRRTYSTGLRAHSPDRRTYSSGLTVVNADFVHWRLPADPHVIVGNLPFHLTTAILRKLLHAPAWSSAVLVVQWEVARRRAGVGGASMMTAQWWPWFEFTLHRRVSRQAFRPEPTVDGGLLVMTRRAEPLLPHHDRSAYRQFVHSVFTCKGRGVAAILARVVPPRKKGAIRPSLERAGVRANALPKDLSAEQWVGVFTDLAYRGKSAARGRSGGSRRAPRPAAGGRLGGS